MVYCVLAIGNLVCTILLGIINMLKCFEVLLHLIFYIKEDHI